MRKDTWFRGALLGVLFLGGLALLAVPVAGQAGGGPTNGENDEDEPVYDCGDHPCIDYIEVLGEMPVAFLSGQDPIGATIYLVHFNDGTSGEYACGGSPGSIGRCHRDPYHYGHMVRPPGWLIEKNKRMRERQRKIRDSACAVIEPLSIAGGLSALGTVGLAQFMDDYVAWATRWSFRFAGIPAVIAVEILNGWCYLTAGDTGGTGGESGRLEKELLAR